MIKLLIVDTETTGLVPKKNGIVQLSALLFVEGEGCYTFSEYMNPGDVEIDQKALDTNGLTREQIAGFRPKLEVYWEFTNFLGQHIEKFDKKDKAIFAGYNTAFDDGFIRALADDCGDRYLGSYRYNDLLDVRGIAICALMRDRVEMPNFKLVTVAEKLYYGTIDSLLESMGIKGAAHDALVDCHLTAYVLRRCATMLNMQDVLNVLQEPGKE